MAFHARNFPSSVRPSQGDANKSLFIPLFKEAVTYDLAVGYFTSGWLSATARGIAEFAVRGGKSRWIVSPELNGEDADAILQGGCTKRETQSIAERSIFEIIQNLENRPRDELCTLISCGTLEFRIAVKKNSDAGMLHAKIGVATDAEGALLGYSGSFNNTLRAGKNWERIDVFRGEIASEKERVESIRFDIDSLWNNQDPFYETFAPSEDLLHKISQYLDEALREAILGKASDMASEIKLRPYQEDAINSWFKANGRGMYLMATGTGKTYTALATIAKLKRHINEIEKKPLFVAIVVPLTHLLDQWYIECGKFGIVPTCCYQSTKDWQSPLLERVNMMSVNKGFECALVTNSTFGLPAFQQVLSAVKSNFLLVADEAHNLGAESYLAQLPKNANYRLGLTATPDRHNDELGTNALLKYFGDPVVDFPLEKAIEHDFLCPYEYFANVCQMTHQEYDEYRSLSDEIAALRSGENEDKNNSEKIRSLQGKRADIITGVESKLHKLRDLLQNQMDSGSMHHTLIYCGSRVGEDGDRHIERTQKLLGGLGIKSHKFTSEENLKDRAELLRLFASGERQALSAIKCLDEGVDVPDTRVAYILASTSNSREYIQRRGRVLRKSPGKEKAEIHDFLVIPPDQYSDDTEMFEREAMRAFEFAQHALNAPAAIRELECLRRNYHL